MPTTRVFLTQDVNLDANFPHFMRNLVAREMSCEGLEVHRSEVDFLLFVSTSCAGSPIRTEGFYLEGGSDVIVEIVGFGNNPNRMNNMSDRLAAVKKAVKLSVGEHRQVSVRFIPVQEDYWVSG
jgi:hypothetical protein